TAETIFVVFKVASENARSGIPVRRETDWVDIVEDFHLSNRRGVLQEIAIYCALPDGVQRRQWAPDVFKRMAVVSCDADVLPWGTIGATVTGVFDSYDSAPNIGCRSLSCLIYGGISTLILAMLLTSSILAHYSASYSRQSLPLSARVSLVLSH
ncbi:uncharacterized protein EDB91DRAFT_1049637, partial [Suillus paluster]|uniref:uncharacterized protein n=1 Tax=Suillus paluster TaxID=48578 RepID=UPI001B872E27